MKPVCVPCKRFFRPAKNGVYLLESKPAHPDTPAGTMCSDEWLPYKVWQADLWKCQGCGAEIISGFGRKPVAEEHKPRFDSWVESATHKVNDC